MKEKQRKIRTRKRGKKAVFDPNTTSNPLSDLFSKPKPKDPFPELGTKPVANVAKKTRPKPVKAVKKNYTTIDGIDPVELFAAYHLGLTQEKGYQPQNINDVSRRFNSSPARIKEILAKYDLDSESVMSKDFDMGLAQLDIKVAPAGIDRGEIAQQLYDEFREAPLIVRDWQDELSKDAEENRKIFEKLK